MAAARNRDEILGALRVCAQHIPQCRYFNLMSIANLFGEHPGSGELLKLAIDVGQTTVAKYMARRRGPLSQGWKTFLHNHADAIASIDMFVVPTVSFRRNYE